MPTLARTRRTAGRRGVAGCRWGRCVSAAANRTARRGSTAPPTPPTTDPSGQRLRAVNAPGMMTDGECEGAATLWLTEPRIELTELRAPRLPTMTTPEPRLSSLERLARTHTSRAESSAPTKSRANSRTALRKDRPPARMYPARTRASACRRAHRHQKPGATPSGLAGAQSNARRE